MLLLGSWCTQATETSPRTESPANLQSRGEVLGVLRSSVLSLQTRLWLGVRSCHQPLLTGESNKNASLCTPMC